MGKYRMCSWPRPHSTKDVYVLGNSYTLTRTPSLFSCTSNVHARTHTSTNRAGPTPASTRTLFTTTQQAALSSLKVISFSP